MCNRLITVQGGHARKMWHVNHRFKAESVNDWQKIVKGLYMCSIPTRDYRTRIYF